MLALQILNWYAIPGRLRAELKRFDPLDGTVRCPHQLISRGHRDVKCKHQILKHGTDFATTVIQFFKGLSLVQCLEKDAINHK